MASTPYISSMLLNGAAGASLRPSVRGRARPSTAFYPMFVQRLPSDALGTAQLIITGAKPGTEIHVFSSEGVLLAGAESAALSQSFTLPRFVSGDARNTVRVLLASLGYENIDLDVTVSTVPVTIPVFQRKDRTYRNPT